MINAEDEVKFYVSDTGRGIKEEDIPRVFQKFQQFGRVGGGGPKGTGLGLAIAKELMLLHEGSIRIESKINEGTKFICSLPKAESESAFRSYIKKGLRESTQKGEPLILISVRIDNFSGLR